LLCEKVVLPFDVRFFGHGVSQALKPAALRFEALHDKVGRRGDRQVLAILAVSDQPDLFWRRDVRKPADDEVRLLLPDEMRQKGNTGAGFGCRRLGNDGRRQREDSEYLQECDRAECSGARSPSRSRNPARSI
jgi:hypothetical protein